MWEPNALLKLSEIDERASEALSEKKGSTPFPVSSEAIIEILEPLMALSVNFADTSYAVRNDGGIIVVYDTYRNRLLELTEWFMTIEHLCWSDHGHRITSADLSRVIMVDSVLHSTEKPAK